MTYTLIAVDGGGCHSFVVEISEARYHRPKYMEALYNSIEMVFKKLKYHKGKMDITITEVINESNTTSHSSKQKRAKAHVQDGETGQGALGTSRSKRVELAGSEGKLQTFKVTA